MFTDIIGVILLALVVIAFISVRGLVSEHSSN